MSVGSGPCLTGACASIELDSDCAWFGLVNFVVVYFNDWMFGGI